MVKPGLGVDPRPYMLVNWLIHGACVVLVYALARRHGGRIAALVAAGLFGSSRLFYSVVSQVVGVGEMLALTFTLAACLASSARRRAWRWAGPPLFAAALLSKESVALLPLALLPSPAVGETVRERAKRVAPLFASGVLFVAYLLFSGVRHAMFAGKAYETAFGSNLVSSLVLYAGWSVDLEYFTPDYYGASTQVPWVPGIGLIVALAAVAWFARKRTRAPAVGAAWWLLGLIPVLALLWQRYVNYLYAPSAGLALALGGFVEWALVREPKPKSSATRATKAKRARGAPGTSRFSLALAWGAAVALVVAHASWSESLLRARQASRLAYADIPLDPVVRKMELARRVATRVKAALGDRPARVVFYIPDAGERNTFFADLLQSVLDHGRGLRAVCPNLDSVAFVSHWTPAYRDFELFAGSVDGLVDHLGTGPDAHLRLAAKLERFRLPRQANQHLRAALLAYPEDPRLHLARAGTALHVGDRAEAAAECRKTIELAASSALADSARALLGRLDGAHPHD